MEFKALSAPKLTEEVAVKLETLLNNRSGVEEYIISVERQMFQILFDETILPFHKLVQVMAKAGCPMQSIGAAIFKE